MKAYETISLLCAATSNLMNVFEMIGYLKEDDLDSCSHTLMLSPAAELVRKLAFELSEDLFDSEDMDRIRNLYIHCHEESVGANCDDESHLKYQGIASMESDARKIFHKAHAISSEMYDAKSRYGF